MSAEKTTIESLARHPVYPSHSVEPPRRRAYIYREASDHLDLLYAALSDAQGDIGAIPKRHRSHYGTYADLADIRQGTHKQLAKHGLSIHQTLQLVGDSTVLVTTLGHKSGQWVSSVFPIRTGSNPQQTAAAVTYARRMALSALLSLATEEEDDGEAAAVAATTGPSNKLFAAASAAIRSAANREEIKAKVEKAFALFQEGRFSQEEIDELMEVADARTKEMKPNAE